MSCIGGVVTQKGTVSKGAVLLVNSSRVTGSRGVSRSSISPEALSARLASWYLLKLIPLILPGFGLRLISQCRQLLE